MKFESRKDLTFSLVIFGLIALLIGIAVVGLVTGEMEQHEYWTLIPIIGFVGLFFWFYFGTNYELTEREFIYRCGPFNGKVNVDRITEIGKGHTPWIGLKYATARKGLNVKFDKYNEIYISPKTEDTFIKKILELNNGIKISDGQTELK
tara:strand:- start:29 stop:475 length:447 start_codon:yes stop_codon:yes gene_type:complete